MIWPCLDSCWAKKLWYWDFELKSVTRTHPYQPVDVACYEALEKLPLWLCNSNVCSQWELTMYKRLYFKSFIGSSSWINVPPTFGSIRVMARPLKNTLKNLKLKREAGLSKSSHLVKHMWLDFTIKPDPQPCLRSTQDWHEHLKVCGLCLWPKSYCNIIADLLVYERSEILSLSGGRLQYSAYFWLWSHVLPPSTDTPLSVFSGTTCMEECFYIVVVVYIQYVYMCVYWLALGWAWRVSNYPGKVFQCFRSGA